MTGLRTIIIHPRPEIRQSLRRMIAGEKDLRLLAEATDGATGLAAMEQHQPQLVFLGIQLGGMDGFELLRAAGPELQPAIIFVSPCDQYAARAFEVHAVDYLLKPFSRERFAQAVQRARQRLGGQGGTATNQVPPIISARAGRNIVLLRPDEIVSVIAEGAQTRIHTAEAAYQARQSLSVLEQRLPARQFVRLNRSTLVNVGQIREFSRRSHGDGLLELENGQQHRLSRRYRARWGFLFDADRMAGQLTQPGPGNPMQKSVV